METSSLRCSVCVRVCVGANGVHDGAKIGFYEATKKFAQYALLEKQTIICVNKKKTIFAREVGKLRVKAAPSLCP